jgi:hypothetical protein
LNPALAILRRAALVVVGFGASTLAASLLAHVVMIGGTGIDGFRHLRDIAGPLWLSIPLVAVFAGTIGFVPGGLAIALAETFSIRSWMFFTVAGLGGTLVAMFAAAGVTTTFGAIGNALSGEWPPAEFGVTMPLLMLLAGAVSGLTYWVVAGRGSGDWRVSAPEP